MNDINEIYAPIYREPNRLPYIVLLILLTLIVGLVIYYVIKKIKNRPVKIRSLDEIYSDCIDDITSLGSELQERHLYCFKDFLSNIYRENFYAKTHEELLNSDKLEELNIQQLLDTCNKKFYSGVAIEPEYEAQTVRDLVECITQIYNRESVVKND